MQGYLDELSSRLEFEEGSYDYLLSEIHLSKSLPELMEENQDQHPGFATLAHEFTHYLQYYTTGAGLQSTLFVFEFLTLFTITAANPKIEPIPILIQGSEFDRSFRQKDFTNLKTCLKFGEKINVPEPPTDDFVLHTEKHTRPYLERERTVALISYKGEWIPISELCLRENMAIVATFRTPICNSLNSKDVLDLAEKSYQPKYWIILRVLWEYFGSDDCLSHTYWLCEQCLMTPDPAESAGCFILSLQGHTGTSELNFKQCFSEWTTACSITTKAQIFLECLDEHAQTLQNCLKELEEKSSLLQSIDIRINRMLSGIKFRRETVSTYSDNFDGIRLMDLIEAIGCPPITFVGAGHEKKYLGVVPGDEHQHQEIYACLMLIDHLYQWNSINDPNSPSEDCGHKKCPFFPPRSFCNESRGPLCQDDYLQIMNNSVYSGCLLHNTLTQLSLAKK